MDVVYPTTQSVSVKTRGVSRFLTNSNISPR